jgi:hypothetical protein
MPEKCKQSFWIHKVNWVILDNNPVNPFQLRRRTPYIPTSLEAILKESLPLILASIFKERM